MGQQWVSCSLVLLAVHTTVCISCSSVASRRVAPPITEPVISARSRALLAHK